jgi:hypothetical protein
MSLIDPEVNEIYAVHQRFRTRQNRKRRIKVFKNNISLSWSLERYLARTNAVLIFIAIMIICCSVYLLVQIGGVAKWPNESFVHELILRVSLMTAYGTLIFLSSILGHLTLAFLDDESVSKALKGTRVLVSHCIVAFSIILFEAASIASSFYILYGLPVAGGKLSRLESEYALLFNGLFFCATTSGMDGKHHH